MLCYIRLHSKSWKVLTRFDTHSRSAQIKEKKLTGFLFEV